ncbi:MAG: nucleoside phosphorylase [Armatimonadota bacterium]|nr:nucleoside phosphorylase [Armatimonadota bacterium]MDR7427530.1 nucleoside phosphorylase [Armatimonadota bacterium]MDR7463460.1 nucleoside phosphorylase [Armatimonadota bacterium]MDR7469694.1 nucleoside phosphorylase [Armatimonadota bacterium]MDR7473973.1 nucleoside phosphorylase [Armatimonadota bacterium]
MSEQPQRHIRVTTGAMPRYCLIPGDPARAERIAARMEGAREVIRHREFLGFRGQISGVAVGVCSTGIGGPSASIAVEELANIGVDTFIRVGSAGGRQPTVPVGSLVVVTAAHRGEGTSSAYLPPEFPAVADLDVTAALMESARALGYPFTWGIVTTRDAFYRRDQRLAELLSTVGGVVAAEQECAAVFIVATVRRARAGAVLAIDSNILLPRLDPDEGERLFRQAEARAIEVALGAVVRLAARDGGTVDGPGEVAGCRR